MFGNMFNDIDVVRFNKAGESVQQLRVPIAYGPKEKFLIKPASYNFYGRHSWQAPRWNDQEIVNLIEESKDKDIISFHTWVDS